MLELLKEEVLALLPGEEVAAEVVLEEPPVAEEFCTCPHCGCTGAEVWNSSDAYVANCPECHLEFVPVMEGARATIERIMERHRRKRSRGKGPRYSKERLKDAVLNLKK